MRVGGVCFAGEFVCSREFAGECETLGSVGREEVVTLDILFCFFCVLGRIWKTKEKWTNGNIKPLSYPLTLTLYQSGK